MSTEKKKKLPIIILAIAVPVAAVGGAVLYGEFFSNHEDSEVIDIPEGIVEADEEDRKDDGSDSDVSMKYAGYVTLYNDDKYMTMNFTNPGKSKKSMSLEIIANVAGEDILLATTGKIRPGYKVNKVETERKYAIPEGTYDGKYRVHFYNEEGSEEIVNSEIKIKVYVK